MKAIELWFLWFVLYSFIGWVYESTLCSVTGKKLVNRGFLNGPICPVYGAGAVLVLLILQPLKGNPALLFITSALLTTSLEYLTSYLMEVFFHARWWDYSKRFLNIHGRVCLLGFAAFGAMSVLAVEFVHPWVSSLTARLSDVQRNVVCAVLLFALASDLILTLITVAGLDERLRAVKQRVGERMPRIAGLHAFQLRRLSDAFPHLHFTRYHEEWQQVKTRLKEKIERRRADFK